MSREALLELQQQLVDAYALGPLEVKLRRESDTGVVRVELRDPCCQRVLAVGIDELEEGSLDARYQIALDIGNGLELVDRAYSVDGLLHDIALNFVSTQWDFNLFEAVIHHKHEGATPVNWPNRAMTCYVKHYLVGGEMALLRLPNMADVTSTMFGRIDVGGVPHFIYGIDTE